VLPGCKQNKPLCRLTVAQPANNILAGGAHQFLARTLMKIVSQILIAVAMVGTFVVPPATAQQQTVRLRGIIEKRDGNILMVKSRDGAELKLNLADKLLIVEVVKASIADIKEGSFIGSGAMPQPDGSQKAIEVHIFAESMRGTGEGFRPWDGAPNSTMNGSVGTTVTSVDGPIISVKYKDGEKKIVVTPNVPIVRYEVSNNSALKPGASFSVNAAVKKPDGTFDVSRLNVGRDGVVPN
jgi:hypothetical protein